MKAKPQKGAKPADQKMRAEASANSQSCPHLVNFFRHFKPDRVNSDPGSKEDFENLVLLSAILGGKTDLFPLYLPVLEEMYKLALTGNQSTAHFLVQLAIHLCWRITVLEKNQPLVMRDIARKLNVWPVVTQPGFEKETLARVAELQLGEDIRHIDIRFRKAGGCDENYPARLWAKEAVFCINYTRVVQRKLASIREDEVNKILEPGTWKRAVEPAWVSLTKDLPDFSNRTRPKWAHVIREMIREELPEFHLRPEWETQRKSSKASGRSTKGEIQNAILDDIVAALKTVSPDEAPRIC